MTTVTTAALSDDERMVIDNYRRLPPTAKREMLRLVADWANAGSRAGPATSGARGAQALAAVAGTLHISDGELREIGDFLRACDEVETECPATF